MVERKTYDYQIDDDVKLIYDFPHRDDFESDEIEISMARRVFLIVIVIIMIAAFLSYTLIPLLQTSSLMPEPTPIPPTHIAPLI